MAGFLTRHPFFDLCVESGIRHHVLGGFFYGVALYLVWIEATRSNDKQARLRILTILAGSSLAIGLTIIAGELVAWPPPARHPDLHHLFRNIMHPNPNHNCFPSQSTTLYACVALGLIPVRRWWGIGLAIGVLPLVSLPRMYVGGHYLSDVLAGLALAAIGYTAVRAVLERPVLAKVEAIFERGGTRRTLAEIFMFFWIYQVTVGFQEVVWARRAIETLIG